MSITQASRSRHRSDTGREPLPDQFACIFVHEGGYHKNIFHLGGTTNLVIQTPLTILMIYDKGWLAAFEMCWVMTGIASSYLFHLFFQK